MPMSLKLICALALAITLCPLLGQAAHAAALKDLQLKVEQYYIDVTLSFDARPSYSESFRYDPDRYLLTLDKCKLALPKEKQAIYEKIDNNLLTRISLYQGGENASIGF